MRHAALLLAAVFLSAPALAQQASAQRPVADMRAFDREVRECAELLRLPGLAVAVVHDGEVIHRLSLGFADVESKTPIGDDSVFWLASITKTFSAVMLMQYQQEGRLSLEDPLISFPFTSVGFLPQRIEPNVRLKHVLSHTSESTPGTAFVYHGGRYNFIYGVFERMGGLRFPEAYHRELNARILQPLALEATLAGYPRDDPLRARVVTPYVFDSTRRQFEVNRDALGPGPAFPASGLLSCVKDLAAYTTALDRDRLLIRSSYETMCSPFRCNDAQPTPYGLGWFTSEFKGVRLHWAYGLGDSDSAILVRVPSRKLTLIVLCNSSFATAPSRLGGGNPLTSPFIVAFLKHLVLGNEADTAPIDYGGDVENIRQALKQSLAADPGSIRLAELLSQALTRSFAELTFGGSSRQGEALTRLLFDLKPDEFTKNDPAIFHLLSLHSGPALDDASAQAVESFHARGRFHPWILFSIARRFEAKGNTASAAKYYHLLADTNGFEEQADKIEACFLLGRHYATQRDLERARDYLWRALIYTRQVGGNDARIAQELDDLSRLATPNAKR